jgi:16S rRNA (cytosine967-C5)-methyltransferase
MQHGRNADDAFEAFATHNDRRAIRAITLGALRWWSRFDAIVTRLLQRPTAETPPLLRALLVAAIHQLEQSRNPRESTVSAAVDAARELGLARAAGMVNAILRRFLRERESLLAEVDRELALRHAHPEWLVARLIKAWPAQYEAILTANNAHPPMTLRINRARTSIVEYRKLLAAEELSATALEWLDTALVLDKPVTVNRLPLFAEGAVAVQDGGAQLAARLLAPGAEENILDACAAPGGKSCALLELVPDLQLTALDSDPVRMRRVEDNLKRQGLHARLVTADLLQAPEWWDGQPYDAILLDAPCSATGVIRRHPEIKWLRRDSDIGHLALRQLELLAACWRLLKPGGRLLYVTCSVLPDENCDVITRFLAGESTAREYELTAMTPFDRQSHGIQLLPGASGADGFYYAGLTRISMTTNA